MRYLAFVLSVALSAAPIAQAQADPQSRYFATRDGEIELEEIRSGDRWLVFERVDARARTDLAPTHRVAVFPAYVLDELEEEGILPPGEAEDIRDLLAREGLDYRQVGDVFAVHLEAAMAAEKSSEPAPEMVEKGCWGWQKPKTKNESWKGDHPGVFDLIHVDEGPFLGTLTATLPFAGEVDVAVTYQLKKRLCVPYKFRLIQVEAVGEAEISGHVIAAAELHYAEEWHWRRNLYTFDLGSLTVWLGLIPVFLDFELPLDLGIDASVRADGSAELRADLQATARFDVICTTAGCSGPTTYDHAFDAADPIYDLTLDADARIWAQAAVNVEIYDDDLGLASVGATGFVQTHLFGYLGNQCGDADGDGDGDEIADLLLDLDVGYDVFARLDGLFLPDGEWILLEGGRHLRTWDLFDGDDGWNVLDPVILGSGQVELAEAGDMVTFSFGPRPCHPYPDDLRLRWTGPVNGSGWLTPHFGTLTDSDPCAAGDYVLNVTMMEDLHGRVFGTSTSMPVTVTVSLIFADGFESGDTTRWL